MKYPNSGLGAFLDKVKIFFQDMFSFISLNTDSYIIYKMRVTSDKNMFHANTLSRKVSPVIYPPEKCLFNR